MIKFHDKYGNGLSFCDFIEVQWTRRWSSAGEFTVYMAAKDYNPDIKYVKNTDRPETGMVMKTVYSESSNGEFVTLSGFFLEKVADFGQIIFNYEQSFSAGSTLFEDLMIKGFRTPFDEGGKPFYYNLYRYAIDENSQFPSSGFDINIEKGTGVGTAFYDILSASGYSFVCSPWFNPLGKVREETEPLIGLEFLFKAPRDLTDKVFFGKQYYNASSINYTLDESNIKSQYVISQENLQGDISKWTGTGKFYIVDTEFVEGNQILIGRENYLNESNRPSNIGYCLPMKAYTTNVDGVELVPANVSKIISQMKQQAQVDMLNNYKIEEIEVEALQNRFYYLTDYDLGDKCTIVLDALNQMWTARIEEVREVHKNNMVEIELVFGTPRKTKWRELK